MSKKAYTWDDYTITRDGRVFNNQTNTEMKQFENSKGYKMVVIHCKQWRVHRLVAEKYVPNPDNKPQVNHIDGNKKNNNADNLEWVTNYENRQHALKNNLHVNGDKCPWSILKEDDIKRIRRNEENFSIKEWSDYYNVAYRTMWDIVNNKTWKNVG